MRSNASASTGPAGIAMHHSNGTGVSPPASTAAMAPAAAAALPRIVPSNAGPATRPG